MKTLNETERSYFSSLAAPDVVRMTTSGATGDEKVISVTTYWFQCYNAQWDFDLFPYLLIILYQMHTVLFMTYNTITRPILQNAFITQNIKIAWNNFM